MTHQSIPAYYWIERGPGGHGTIDAVYLNGSDQAITQVPQAVGYETDAFTWGYQGSSPKATAAAITTHFGQSGLVKVGPEAIERLYVVVANWDQESNQALSSLDLYLVLLGQA